MTDTISIQGTLRAESGTGPARSARRNGFVPAVVYGKGQHNLHVALPQAEVEELYISSRLGTRLIEIHIDGQKHTVLPKQFSVHPVNGSVMHADFMFAEYSDTMKVKIPVRLKGKDKSPGIKKNGVINLVYKSLPCRVFRDSIPPCIEIDVSNADVGFSMTLADIQLPQDVKLLMPNMNQTLLRLTGKRKVVEEIEIKKPEGEVAAGATSDASGAKAPAAEAGKEKAPDEKAKAESDKASDKKEKK